jgi:hypothetical protein
VTDSGPIGPSASFASYLARRRASRGAPELPALALEAYTAEQVTFAARAWTMRAAEEHQSATIFAEALSHLVDGETPTDVLAVLTQIVADELDHSALCAELARVFGAPAPRRISLPRPSEPSTVEGRRRRGVRILLVEGAIGETLSSALFNVGRTVAEEPRTKQALSRILRDEVLHARLFWEALAVLRPGFDDAELERLQREITHAFGAIERAQMLPALQRLERAEPFDPAWAALGVLPPERRVDAFYGAIERRVRPGLTRLGLDADRAWEHRYRG